MCEKAFLLARKKGRPLLSLFSCMVGSGLPELKQEKYVSFIRYGMPNIVALKHLPDIFFPLSLTRDTLCLEKTEEKALLKFRQAMRNAIEKSCFVNINWYMHNLARTGN